MRKNKSIAKEKVTNSGSVSGDDSFMLHLSEFEGNQRRYLIDCIDSNFIPSVGDKVKDLAELVAEYIRSRFVIYIEFRSFILIFCDV